MDSTGGIEKMKNMKKTTLWWRKTQILMAAEQKIPIEELKPPLNEKEKEEYYKAYKDAEELRKFYGDQNSYIPNELYKEAYYIEDKYWDDFREIIKKCFKNSIKWNRKQVKKKIRAEKKEKKAAKKKKKHK